MITDQWGTALAASNPASADAFNSAWDNALHFVGDPLATLEVANATDETFALGSVFCATYRLLGGLPGNDPVVLRDIERANARAEVSRERGHVAALKHLAAGDFTMAGKAWDDVADDHRDFAAVRFAHDVYLSLIHI